MVPCATSPGKKSKGAELRDQSQPSNVLVTAMPERTPMLGLSKCTVEATLPMDYQLTQP